MIDTKYLQLILAIDQYGSLSNASKELNLTQSALSHQLKNLEDLIGIPLFHRRNKRLYFTEAGKELRDRATKIMEDFERLNQRMIEIKEDQLSRYIHGYSQEEAMRLQNQASTVSDYLHFDSVWDSGSTILEVGCGVGAQTSIIATQNPTCQFVSIDISADSIRRAQAKMDGLGIENVECKVADVRDLAASKTEQFDHVFVCFVLEHLANPVEILTQLKNLLKPSGTITVIEGDHGSTFFYPDNKAAQKVVWAQTELQAKRGGDANIGRALYPLLQKAGFKQAEVSPRQIYVDASKEGLVDGFIKNTFTAMIQGMGEELIAEEVVTKSEYEKGIDGLLRTAEVDGVFSYTFFKGKAMK